MRTFILAISVVMPMLVIPTGCSLLPDWTQESPDASATLDSSLLAANRSGPVLRPQHGRVLTDNDDAFETKLALIKNARKSIDLAYYIFADDYSSSLIAKELLAATERGVAVRLLLDYHSHYASLDYFRMLEHYGRRSNGSLDVRFYNRPTANIVKDAVFMTLGCGAVDGRENADKAGCSEAKFREIDALFAEEIIDGVPAANRNISNINTGNSGLFLSGLYAKNPELMAMAVSRGQQVDIEQLKNGAGESNPDELQQLKQLGKLYWQANYGAGLDRLVNRVKLSAAFVFYGEQVDPIYDTFSAFLPVERSNAVDADKQSVRQARNDWRYLSDFLHHKLLLVDQNEMVTGGRNVEDSYHMNPGSLSAKYTFMDTDVHLTFAQPQPELSESFDKLWQFKSMVATLDEVQRHAPNDFLVHSAAAGKACRSLLGNKAEAHQSCIEKSLKEQQRTTLESRLQARHEAMQHKALVYLEQYTRAPREQRSPLFDLDAQAQAHYLENLSFDKSLPSDEASRFQGASNGHEGASGKHIHAVWLAALNRSCSMATAENPVTVYLHNAYFFLPSNLLSAMARMVDGRQSCANTHIVVLTNSIETTDLNVVNVLSRHSMKALFEHYANNRSGDNGATLSYHEYQTSDARQQLSLHSKVMLFGDDIFIGSANADLRSYLMDSNNGLLIRQAPELLDHYRQWLESLLQDAQRTDNQTHYYLSTPRDTILEEGDLLVEAELEKYQADRFIKDPQQISELKARLRKASDEVYRLSREIVADDTGSRDAQTLFNDLFKAI